MNSRFLGWGVAAALAALFVVSITAAAADAPVFTTQGLALWLRADGKVTTNSSGVTLWGNEVSSGGASQTSTAKEPRVFAQAANGKPAIYFDGNDDQLDYQLPINGTTGLTIFLVSSSDNNEDGGSGGQENAVLLWTANGSAGVTHLSAFQNRITWRFGASTNGKTFTYKRPATIGTALSLTTLIKNASTESVFVSGLQAMSVSGRPTALSGVGSQARIGRGHPSGYFKGNVAEVLVFTRALQDSDRQAVESYLRTKYFGQTPNRPPEAQNSTVTVTQDQTVAISLSATDPDGDALSYRISQSPIHGTLSGTAPALNYKPATGYSGGDSFTWEVSDGKGGVAQGKTTVTVIAPPPPSDSSVAIYPGTSIQSVVGAKPEGTTFIIKAGVHRLQTIRPKNGNKFIGEPGATLSGAQVLTLSPTTASVGGQNQPVWIATGQRQESPRRGECAADSPVCDFNEDVYFDDVLLKRVSSVSQLNAGSFYFDYARDQIYIARDPAGHKVEAAVNSVAFEGTASNVTVRGLVVEKYASPAQIGAIMNYGGSGWLIENSEVRWNHGAGIRVDRSAIARSNYVHHNGQLGVAGVGAGILVESNEISYNNTAGFDPFWEAGGTKFALTQDLIVRANRVHHNAGPGLWTDIDNVRTRYENNIVYENDQSGIFHEISYDAIIRDNVVYRNGRAFDAWLGGAQIQIAGSQNVEVFGNTVTVDAVGGNGIALIQQNRGSGIYGPWKTLNNYVHHNDITYLGDGMSGALADDDLAGMLNGNNRFDFNRYHCMVAGNRWFWVDDDFPLNLAGIRSKGQELAATVDSVIISP